MEVSIRRESIGFLLGEGVELEENVTKKKNVKLGTFQCIMVNSFFQKITGHFGCLHMHFITASTFISIGPFKNLHTAGQDP